MTTETASKAPSLWGILMLLAAFLGLCTIFVSLATAYDAWQERVQSRWPMATACVVSCGLERTSSGEREKFYIVCRLSYTVGAEQNSANVYSTNVPSREIWQYPPNQIATYEEWVEEHPAGTPLIVRYDPANHKKVVLAADYMPRGGPPTQRNLKLLEACAGSFLVLLIIARLTRPRLQSLPVT